MHIDMTAYKDWCNKLTKGGMPHRDTPARREAYQVGFKAGMAAAAARAGGRPKPEREPQR